MKKKTKKVAVESGDIEFKFIGKGVFVPGVPARDLTPGEAKKRGVLELVLESPFYEKVETPVADDTEKGE